MNKLSYDNKSYFLFTMHTVYRTERKLVSLIFVSSPSSKALPWDNQNSLIVMCDSFVFIFDETNNKFIVEYIFKGVKWFIKILVYINLIKKGALNTYRFIFVVVEI